MFMIAKKHSKRDVISTYTSFLKDLKCSGLEMIRNTFRFHVSKRLVIVVVDSCVDAKSLSVEFFEDSSHVSIKIRNFLRSLKSR